MRIFVFEYVTGGGFLDRPLPPSLAQEGDLMLGALVRDLSALGHEVWLLRDARLPPAVQGAEIRQIQHSRELVPELRRAIAACDACWPVAPETGGELERLCDAVVMSGRILLGSRPQAVRIAASKFETLTRLAQADIPVVATLRAPAALENGPLPPGPWVLKPDDGAGCEQTFVVRHLAELRNRIAAAPNPGHLIVQPLVAGVDASLSLLLDQHQCAVIGRNRQYIVHHRDALQLAGCVVNGLEWGAEEAGALARGIAAALPGLWGYVGVDLLLTPQGPCVLEVNPRLTTSYAGLSRSLGVNAAGLVLDLLRPVAARSPVPTDGQPVAINLASEHAA